MQKSYKNLIIIFIVFAAISAPIATYAIPELIPKCALAVGKEAPPLSCFLELLGNISRWILGISGSLALLYFIYGGFMLLTSRGSEEQITKGKTILSRAIIGVIIIFGAYTAVEFLTRAVGFQSEQFKPEEKPPEESINKPQAPTCECICEAILDIRNTRRIKIGGYLSAEACKTACEKQKDKYIGCDFQGSIQQTCNPCICKWTGKLYRYPAGTEITQGIKTLDECKKICEPKGTYECK